MTENSEQPTEQPEQVGNATGETSAVEPAAENSAESPPEQQGVSDPATAEATPETAASPPPSQPAPSQLAPSQPAASDSDSSASERQKLKVNIGSRLGAKPPRSSTPQTAVPKEPLSITPPEPSSPRPKPEPAATPLAVPEPVPTPSRRDPLTPDLEQEIDAALGNMSLEDLMGGGTAVDGEQLELESKHRAAVVKIHGDNVFFSLGGRYEGVVSLRQFKDPPEVGSTHDVIISSYSADDGLYELLIPGASISVSDWSDVSEGAVVEARVTGSNTGGLECMVNTLRGFIPASQISIYRVENLPDYVDQKLRCVVTEVDPQRRNLVLSHRAVLEREREAARQQLLDELAVGQTREGVVRNIRDFGAFVDLGGVDGMIHISQLSWERVNHPSEVLEEGQKVSVKIDKIDRDTNKISLSYRDLLEHPWEGVQEKFVLGSVVSGTISRIAKFGAFVKLSHGIEGLVHISELDHRRVKNVGSVVSEGQQVEVKVLSIDADAQRIGLSIKGAQQSPAEAAETAAEEEDEPARELAVKPRGGPLKGGRDRPSGGDQFGLNW